ncbi:MAG TPA: stage III sporulation protein AC [Candidatus Fimenecus excrementigallinarum]|uniref:Stage III sporulation protein AC n=1 Tax=Candidatus Fimenecus excrementigallinarum TaxID=2840816 RepID=A0A9D1IGY9_9FIRM|nr:stage III sporulation protein AC [Candidatus Fimenecus excrementigallinarum]
MEIELLLKIAAIGIIVALLNTVLSRSGREEYAMLTVLAGILLIVVMLLPQIGTLTQTFRSAFDF